MIIEGIYVFIKIFRNFTIHSLHFAAQGQFPKMVIGTVYVTDLDDHDVTDKVFEIDPSTSMEVDTFFDVDYNSGEITMMKNTPSGTYLLRVKVRRFVDVLKKNVSAKNITPKSSSALTDPIFCPAGEGSVPE